MSLSPSTSLLNFNVGSCLLIWCKDSQDKPSTGQGQLLMAIIAQFTLVEMRIPIWGMVFRPSGVSVSDNVCVITPYLTTI